LCWFCAATITRRVNDISDPNNAWEKVRKMLAFHDKIVEEERERHERLHGNESQASPPSSNERPKLRKASSTPPSVSFKLD
jgi:hypothetical protein